MNKSLFLSLLLLTGTGLLHAQGNAYVRQDTLFSVLPGYRAQLKSLDSLKAVFAEELQSDQQKLEQKANALLAPYSPQANESAEKLLGRLNTADASRYALIQKEAVLLEERKKSYNEILDAHFKQNIRPRINKLNGIIEAYAAKNKYDMVFILEEIAPSLAYVNKGKDITPAIIRELLK